MGVLDDTRDDVFDIKTSRSQTSLQLVGRSDIRWLDVTLLRRHGVRVLGRLVRADRDRAYFDDDLIATTAASDVKLAELLARIDAFIPKAGLPATPPEPFEPTWTSALGVTKTSIDLRAAGIDTVIWATGFRRRYPWLHVPALDQRGEIVHRDGITPVPGLFVLGLHFQRRRNSAFIDGVGDDAAFLADLIAGRAPSLARAASRARKKTPWPMRLTG
jgi:putative flavoprotein involved in K+ transport